MVIVSQLFNQLLPSTVGGDGMRIWLLHRSGAPLGLATRSVIIDRVCGLFALMILAFLGAGSLLIEGSGEAEVWFAFVLSAGAMGCILAAPILLRVVTWIPVAFIRRNLEPMTKEIAALQGDRVLLAKIVGISLLGHGFLVIACWSVALSLGVQISLLGMFQILPSVLLIASFPISVAGWGVREGGMVLGLALLGVSSSDAALISILFGLLYLGYGLFGGLVWVINRAPRREQGAGEEVVNRRQCDDQQVSVLPEMP